MALTLKRLAKPKAIPLKKIVDGLGKLKFDGATKHGLDAVAWSDFKGWLAFDVTTIDVARNWLYYGFQPLFDALIREGSRC